MKKVLSIVALFTLVGCSPCKYIAKHPECFMPDSIIINNETVRYEKEYITNDSIVFQEIPCDPVDSIIYKTKTVYKTRNVIKIDTIYKSKEISKINPVNEILKKDNEKLTGKVTKWRFLSGILFIFVCIGLVFLFLRFS